VSNSLDPDETPSNSESHLDQSCLTLIYSISIKNKENGQGLKDRYTCLDLYCLFICLRAVPFPPICWPFLCLVTKKAVFGDFLDENVDFCYCDLLFSVNIFDVVVFILFDLK